MTTKTLAMLVVLLSCRPAMAGEPLMRSMAVTMVNDTVYARLVVQAPSGADSVRVTVTSPYGVASAVHATSPAYADHYVLAMAPPPPGIPAWYVATAVGFRHDSTGPAARDSLQYIGPYPPLGPPVIDTFRVELPRISLDTRYVPSPRGPDTLVAVNGTVVAIIDYRLAHPGFQWP